MEKQVKVFYVGAKAVKHDNVLNRQNLAWNGFGASQMVPADDAVVYCRFPQVWVSEADFESIDKIRHDVAQSQEVVGDDAPADPQSPKTTDAQGDGEIDRDTLIQSAILSLNAGDPKDYTGQGRPRVNRIVEIVGTNVSAEEIDAAIKALKHTGKL